MRGVWTTSCDTTGGVIPNDLLIKLAGPEALWWLAGLGMSSIQQAGQSGCAVVDGWSSASWPFLRHSGGQLARKCCIDWLVCKAETPFL